MHLRWALSTPNSVAAFVQEALRLHQLHHPHVVALLGVTIAGSTGVLGSRAAKSVQLGSTLGLQVACKRLSWGLVSKHIPICLLQASCSWSTALGATCAQRWA